MRRFSALLFLAVVLVLALALGLGAPTAAAQQPTPTPRTAVDGGTLRVALAKDIVTLDPSFAMDSYSVQVIDQVFDTLVTYGQDGSIQPRLATAWKAVSDTVYEFTIRQGVTFHNGRAMTADDVVWTMNRMLDPVTKVPRQHLYMVDKVENAGSGVVRFTLKNAYAPFLSALANRALSIIPREEVEKGADAFARNPVGTGPFKFVSWKPGEGVTLERNAAYFFGKPHLDKVVFRMIPETVVAQQQLETGDIDVIEDAMPDDIVRLQKAGLLQLAPGQSYYYIVFNLKADTAPILKTLGKNPFLDKKVREAVVTAFPVADAIEAVYPGLAEQIRAFGPIPTANWAYDPSLSKLSPKVDVARAKQLLAEAGYPNGFEMEILSMSDAPRKAMAQILQSALSKIGIKASITAPEFSLLLDRANNQTFDIGVFGWGGTPDPHDYVFPLLHTSRRGSGGNNAWYSNPDVDKLIDDAAASTDPAARKAMYSKVQTLFMSDMAHIPLYYKPAIIGAGKRVVGLIADPLLYIPLVTANTNVWLAPQ